MNMYPSGPYSDAFITDSRTRSLDQNPLKNGNPAMDIEPMSIVIEVHFIFLPRPPISRMSSVPHEWITEPEPRNSRALKKAWLNMWKTPAVYPAAPAAMRAALPSFIPMAIMYPPAPRAIIM